MSVPFSSGVDFASAFEGNRRTASSGVAFASVFKEIPRLLSGLDFASSFTLAGLHVGPSSGVLFASSFTSSQTGGVLANLRYRR